MMFTLTKLKYQNALKNLIQLRKITILKEML